MEVIWDLAVVQQIDPFCIGLGIIKDVKVFKTPENLSLIEKEVFEYVKSTSIIDLIKESPIIKAYRRFSWKFLGIDPTKVRPSGEALIRRVLKNQEIPIIKNVVYAINLASVKTQLSFSGFNLDRINPPLIVRYAHPGEFFQGIGTRRRDLNGNELLISDIEKILCIYAYGDADATKLTKDTTNILVMVYGVPGIDERLVKEGVELGLNYIQRTAGGQIGKISVNKIVHRESEPQPLKKQE